MSKKSDKIRDSDTRGRHPQEDMDEELREPLPENLEGRQVSNKEGLHSTAEKLAASRSEFAPRPSAGPVPGAFDGGEPEQAGTGRFRCNACGRYFDDETSLHFHEPECRIAKQSTREGERELLADEQIPHPANDRGR